MPEGRWPRGVTPRPRSGAAAESTSLRRCRNGREEMPRVRGWGGSREELPHAPGRTKLVEVMEFQLSYFKSRKMMLLKCCTQYDSKLGKLSSGHRTGKGQLSFQSQRRQWQPTLVLLPGKSHGRRNLAGCSPWGR